MISTESAIIRARRSAQQAALLNVLLVTIIVLFPFIPDKFKWSVDPFIVVSLVGAGWLVLFFQSLRSSRLVADSQTLIAAGQFDIAEERIDSALRSFSIFRAAKLLGLHHLAAL